MIDKPDYIDYFYKIIPKGWCEVSKLSAGRTLYTFWITPTDIDRFPALFCARSLQIIVDKQGAYKSYRVDLQPARQILAQAEKLLQQAKTAPKVFILTDGIRQRHYSQLEQAKRTAIADQAIEYPTYPIVGWDPRENGSHFSICVDRNSSTYSYVLGVYRIVPLLVDDF